ncbi:MAG: DUF6760 family protein [Dehalococcoidia bacterium]
MAELWQELTYVAYHLHWDLETLLDLEHDDRIRIAREVGGLNQRAMEGYR